MAGLDPQVLVQRMLTMGRQELHGKRTESHAPVIPEGAAAGDADAVFAPLDMRFLQTVGFHAYLDPATGHSAWPVPLGLARNKLWMFGAERDIIHEAPLPGDIFLQRSPRTEDYVHAGLVLTVDSQGLIRDRVYYNLTTMEGDTDHCGMLKGGYTYKVRRRLGPTWGDRFFRWVDLDAADVFRD